MKLKNIKKSKELGSPLSFDIQSSDLEVDADGGDVVPREGVVGKPDEKRALADTGIPDDEEFEQVVVVFAVWRHTYENVLRSKPSLEL